MVEFGIAICLGVLHDEVWDVPFCLVFVMRGSG